MPEENLDGLKTQKIGWVHMREEININKLVPYHSTVNDWMVDFILDGHLPKDVMTRLRRMRMIRRFSAKLQCQIAELATVQEVNDFDIKFDSLFESEEYKSA